MMAGINDFVREDFVHIVKNKSLIEALDMIQTCQRTVNRNPVTVFKSVLTKGELDSIDIVNHIKKNPSIKVIEERVHVVGTNIHEICPTKNKQDLRANLIKTEKAEFIERNSDESDNEYGFRMFQKYFHDTKNETYKTLYARDTVIPPGGKTRLILPKSTLNVPVKGDLRGISSPMWYISGPGSGTVFHDEDGDQPSINLSLKGKNKIYAFIPQTFSDMLAEKLTPVLGRKCALYHKPGVVVNPELLRQWGIPVQFYVQEPGDLIYIGEAVLHCVINNGLTIAEAVNFGTQASVTRSSLSICGCKDRGRINVEEMLERPIQNEMVPISTKKIYKCKFENCISGKQIYNKKELVKHNRLLHGKKPVKCIAKNCKKRYMRKHEMQLHYKKVHEKKNVDTLSKKKKYASQLKKCPFCKVSVTNANYNRHINEHQHVGNSSTDIMGNCDQCGKHMYKRNLSRHFEICRKPICQCGKVCKTIRGLTQHQKTHDQN